MTSASDPIIVNNIEISKENCLNEAYFNQPSVNLANALLGKYLVRRLDNEQLLVGKIVETEAYIGVEDKASHSYNNKRTPRNEPMFMSPGTIYVYFTYGMYHCFNISSLELGSAVLIRSLEPIHGLDSMLNLRDKFNRKRNSNQISSKLENHKKKRTQKRTCINQDEDIQIHKKSLIKEKDLCNGPSKLCISMNIYIDNFNKKNIANCEDIWIQDVHEEAPVIVSSSRIGIGNFAGDWKNKLLRFYILNNKYVSKIDKKREAEMQMSNVTHSLT